MKQKIFTQKFKLLLVMAFAMLVGQNAMGQTIIRFPLSSNGQAYPFSSSSGINSNHPGYFSTDATNPNIALTYANASGWNNSLKSWSSTVLSTVGYHSVSVSAYLKSETGGPAKMNLEYKTSLGDTWHVADTYTLLTTANTPFSTTLPVACSNISTLYLRWHQADFTAVGGGSISDAGKLSYIKTVNITATALLYPVDQSYGINIVARTPTTITVSWTKGSGTNSQLLLMSTSDNFDSALPQNDQTYVPIVGQYTSGIQAIFNTTNPSTPPTFTVQVPSATDTYWFRVFDYAYNNGMERYGVNETTPAADALPTNPVKCDLEKVTLNAATFGLITADFSASVDAPKKGAIIKRGILWNTLPNQVDVDGNPTGNDLSDATDAAGYFNFLNNTVGRAKSIYYKAYVTNEYGTIFTDEYTFNNSPIFTSTIDGPNTWETAARWNVNEVPGFNGHPTHASIDDSPTINGTCTLTATNSVTNLTINSGKKLSISAATTLTVAGTLSNNATTSGLVVKAGNGTTANASLIFSNKALNQNVPASVEMYSKASTAGGNHWQYFGVPVQGQTVGTTFGGSERVRRFNEANFDPTGNDYGLWYPYPDPTMTFGETLSPVVGYEVVQSSAKTYTFKGNLNASDFNHPLAYTTAPQLADYAGQNIIANPYTAAINISGLGFGSAEATAYLYNTGSRQEWETNNGASNPGINPGTYLAVPGALAGSLEIPSEIPSMQGFLVKTTTPTSISIPYSSVVTNTVPQRAPALDQKVATMIDVIGSRSSDRMWIFSLPTCTRNFDNGFDGRKILGYNTQLFAMEGSEDYQIDAVNDINNTYLGFQSGSETNLKLKFTHQNLENKYSRVYLTDLVENKTIDITASGTEYVFTAVPSTTPSQRFKITTSTTDNVTPDAGEQIKIFGSQGNAVIQNLSNDQGNAFIYTMGGQFVRNVTFSANGITTISNLKAGAYIVKAKTAANEVNTYLIIR